MKPIMTKLLEFVKARKGYCIFAVALVTIIILGVSFLEIETPDQHKERKNQETEDRQELLAQLEDEKEDDSKEYIEEVSQEGVVSGSSIADSNGQNVSDEIMQEETSMNTQAPVPGETGSLTATPVATPQRDGASQKQEQNITNPNSSTAGQEQNNQSQSVNSQTTQNIPNAQEQNKNNTPDSNEDSQQDVNKDSNANQEEESYVVVNVQIVCDNVIGNPNLTTTATIPADGVILNEKTVIKKGETVYDALKAVCTDHGIAYKNRGSDKNAYITSINGLSEKDCGKYSGWKYKVNDQVSGLASSSYKPENEDRIVWYFAIDITQ